MVLSTAGKVPKAKKLELIPVDVSEQSEGVHYLKYLIQMQTTTASASRSFLRLTERKQIWEKLPKRLEAIKKDMNCCVAPIYKKTTAITTEHRHCGFH